MATRYNYTGGIVTNGLVLNLDAAKTDSYPGTGTTWRDLSGNSNNGTLTNGPTFSGIGKQASIVFDGVDDRVDLTVPTSGDITYALWFKTSANNDNRRLINASTSNFRNFSMGYVGSGANNVLGGFDGTNQPLTTSSFGDGLWHYAVVVMKTNDYKIYVDSVNQTLTWNLGSTGNWVNNNTNVNYIGSAGGAFVFNGNIATTQIYNRALTQTEITQNFNALRGRYGI